MSTLAKAQAAAEAKAAEAGSEVHPTAVLAVSTTNQPFVGRQTCAACVCV